MLEIKYYKVVLQCFAVIAAGCWNFDFIDDHLQFVKRTYLDVVIKL